MGRGTEMILAKEFEGELWIKAADYQRQKKEWVGLTDEEIHNIEQECDQKFEDYFEFANAIEAKLKEKNAT